MLNFKKIFINFLLLVALFGNLACSTENSRILDENIMARQSVRRNFNIGHEIINDYYGSDEVRYGINIAPYSYIMNKYFDLFINFLSTYYYLPNVSSVETLDDLSEGFYAYDVDSKIRYIKEQVIPMYDTYFSENNQVSSVEDDYFNELTLSINAEINEIPVYVEHVEEAVNYFANLGVDLNVSEKMQNPFFSIGGVPYNQIEVLQYIENNISLPYLLETNCEDLCLSNFSRSDGVSNISRTSQYALLAKWFPNIKYRNYNGTFPNISVARLAMSEWSHATDDYLRFNEIPDNGWNRFLWILGCSYHLCLSLETDSNVGGSATLGCRPWATMFMNSGEGLSTYLHELGHVLGLIHEFARPDRDDYIIVNCENIKPDYLHNFKKYNEIAVNSYGEFDINSIMMYPSYSSFCIDQFSPSLTTISGGIINNPRALSANDKLRIKEIYY